MVILASASPQRKTLLEQIDIEPVVVPAHIDEKLDNTDILSSLKSLAANKAAAALAMLHDAVQGGSIDTGAVSAGPVGHTTPRGLYANAAAAAVTHNGGWIIGADTVILFESGILGKPGDSADARRMLHALSGKTHRVATGVYAGRLEKRGHGSAEPGRGRGVADHAEQASMGRQRSGISPGDGPTDALPPTQTNSNSNASQSDLFVVAAHLSDVSITNVNFRSLSDKEIAWYIESGEWQNAAGAYRIQNKGACLVTSIRGSFTNVVGLPLELIYGILIKLGYEF